MGTHFKSFWPVFGFLGFFLVGVFGAHAEITVPELRGPVMDDAGILSTSEQNALEEKIRNYSSVVQEQIWTIKSLEGDTIEGVAIRAASKWKLGIEKKDNGVLIVVAPS